VATSCPGGLGANLGQLLSGPEHARRLDIFAHNLAQAQWLQEDMCTAEFGVTPFSDLTGTGTPLGHTW
jgi:hypothetical protein